MVVVYTNVLSSTAARYRMVGEEGKKVRKGIIKRMVLWGDFNGITAVVPGRNEEVCGRGGGDDNYVVARRDPSTKGRKLWSSRGRRGFEGKKYPDRVKVVEVLHEEWAEHASTYVRLLRLLEIAVECEQERKQGQDIDEQGIEKEGKKTHNNVATPAKIGSVASETPVKIWSARKDIV